MGILGAISQQLFPGRCILCDEIARAKEPLCRMCQEELPGNQHCCPRCAIPLETADAQICGACIKRMPAYHRALAPFVYTSPVDHLVKRFKFHGDLGIGHWMAEAMAGHIETGSHERPELLLPVPLHRRRLRERGFNQSLELARVISSRLGIPVNHKALTRTRHTIPQSGLNAKQRRQNLSGAFELELAHAPRRVVLIDDVMTTGTTVNECARVLKKAGAKRVDVLCFARS